MLSFDHIEMRAGGREEFIEQISEDFPYLAVLSQHDLYHERTVPWHWHQEFELFYVRDGTVDYATPHETRVLGPGSAGLINANVLHMTRAHDGMANVNLLIHMFRAPFVAETSSYLARTYMEPLARATSIEMLALEAHDPATADLRHAIRDSFAPAETEDPGWELRVRDAVSEVWLGLFELAQPRLAEGPATFDDERAERLKAMLDFVSTHYPEKISVADIAAAAFTSERACHRAFRELLGVTPAQHVRDYRVQQACRMLAHTTRPVSVVAQMCGLGTASHFGQVFRASLGMTPSEYRASWQESDTHRQEQR